MSLTQDADSYIEEWARAARARLLKKLDAAEVESGPIAPGSRRTPTLNQ
jgi:hypothetical protein